MQRLGHIVLQTTKYVESLNWYLDHLGLIVSDFCFFPGQRERGPVMSFIRCDRGATPADHHTLAMALGPANRYVHSAYQVCDLDALAAGGEYLASKAIAAPGASAATSRAAKSSTTGATWTDFLVEHFTDGDMFDNTLEPGWAPLTASGLYQWGPAQQGLPGHRNTGRNGERIRHDARRVAPRQRIRPVRPARAVLRSQFLTATPTKESKDTL